VVDGGGGTVVDGGGGVVDGRGVVASTVSLRLLVGRRDAVVSRVASRACAVVRPRYGSNVLANSASAVVASASGVSVAGSVGSVGLTGAASAASDPEFEGSSLALGWSMAESATTGTGATSVTPRVRAMGSSTAKIPLPAPMTAKLQVGVSRGGGLRAMPGKIRDQRGFRPVRIRRPGDNVQ
jgi:hypothetical protein